MCWPQFTILLIIILQSTGFKLNDLSYYDMPRLYELEDYARCELQNGIYCYGSFELLPFNNPSMLQGLQNFSLYESSFNHTRILRGYCLNHSSINIRNASDTLRFTKCVSQDINGRYNLSTKPLNTYCFTKNTADKINVYDIVFLVVISILVLCNIVGTLYDCYASDSHKRNKYLLAWSVTCNWKYLMNTGRESDGHKALDGVKTIIGIMIMLLHIKVAHLKAFTSTPEVIENYSSFASSFFASGTTMVLMFSWLSSYFLVKKITQLKKGPNFISLFPIMLSHRLVRILPVTMFAVALQATCWRHAGSGPMWHAVVTDEANTCRKYWWTHLLFINNFLQRDKKCLVQTWFIAADMQVFILMLPLLLLVSKFKTETALKILSALLCTSLFLLFLITYIWDLKPYLYYDSTKNIAVQWSGVDSFTWLYRAPYTCLPLALAGAWCAYALIYLSDKNIPLSYYKWFPSLHVVSLPLYIVWLSASDWIRCITSPLFIAAYSVMSVVIFAVLLSVFLMGSVRGLRAYSILSWDIWRIPSRMSLAVLTLHMSFSYLVVASSNKENEFSNLRLVTDFTVVWVFTYMAALPTILLLESPFLRTFNAIISKKF